jgi:hypothetical protein
MPESATWLAAAASDQQGPGYTLRIVLLGSMVGVVLLAWFLLRGYRSDGSDSGRGTGKVTGVQARGEVGGDVSGEARSEVPSEVGSAAGRDNGENN